jgi:hypothetical protein
LPERFYLSGRQTDARTHIEVSHHLDQGSGTTLYRKQKVHQLADHAALPSLMQPQDSI